MIFNGNAASKLAKAQDVFRQAQASAKEAVVLASERKDSIRSEVDELLEELRDLDQTEQDANKLSLAIDTLLR